MPHRPIYLVCHARSRTGGPEAIHQLGRTLLDLGHCAHIVYAEVGATPLSHDGVVRFPVLENPMPAAYAHYQVPQAWEIPDTAGTAVVVPELEPAMTRRFCHATPHIWWLSIDNGLGAVEASGGFGALRGSACVHLCQSYYALDFLRRQDLHGLPLFDYTAPEHAAAAAAAETTPRRNRILYPARGAWYAERLRRWAPRLDWQEIKGFTPAQVQDLFRTSKLYVDFGAHPGKDRMPREAALLGCCVITGRRGAAANAFDVPIPDRYKFRGAGWQVPAIVGTIKATLASYEQRLDDFAVYRRIIAGERQEFIAQAARIFGGLIAPFDHAAIHGTPDVVTAPQTPVA